MPSLPAGGWGRFPLSGGNGRRPKGVGIIRPYTQTALLSVGAAVPSGPRQPPSPPGCAKAGGVCTAQDFSNFSPGRPQWAGGKADQPLRFCPPEGYYSIPRRASPVTGVQGAMTVSTAAGKVLTESSPLAHLWLLSVRAESNIASLNYKSPQYPLPSPDTPPGPGDPKSASCGPGRRPPESPSAPRRSAG